MIKEDLSDTELKFLEAIDRCGCARFETDRQLLERLFLMTSRPASEDIARVFNYSMHIMIGVHLNEND